MFVIYFGTVHKHVVVQKGSCSDIWYDHSRETKYCYRPVHASIAITFVLKSLSGEGKALPHNYRSRRGWTPPPPPLPFPHCFASIHSEGQIFRCWMKAKFGLRALISICSTVLHDRLKHKSLEFHMRASAKFFMQGYSHSLWPTRSFCGYRFLH